MKSHQIKALLKKKRYKSLLENNWNPKTVTWKVWLPKIVARDLSVREQWNKKKKKVVTEEVWVGFVEMELYNDYKFEKSLMLFMSLKFQKWMIGVLC